MADRILLSESNFEKVWMSADWTIDVEHTQAGAAFHAERALRQEAMDEYLEPSRRWVPWAVASVLGVAALASQVWRF